MVKLAQRLIEALHPFVANVTQVGNVAYFNLKNKIMSISKNRQDTRSLKHVITTDEWKGCKVIVLGSVKNIDPKRLLAFKEEILKNK